MIKRLSNLIFRNIGWKLVSVLLAMIIWFIVVNETNPSSTKIYTMNLSVSNLYTITESSYVLLNEAELKNVLVDINIRSTRNDLAELNKYESRMRAYIDLKPIDVSKTTRLGENLPITVKFSPPTNLVSSRYEILNINPMTVDIVLDKLVSQSFNITVEKIGEAAAGYVFLQPVTTPESVTITGAQSIIDRISAVRADVTVTDVSESISEIKTLTILDKSGREITSGLKVSVEAVEVSIPINKYAQIPVSEPEIFGEPAFGAHVTAVDWEPKIVEVVGGEDDVDDITFIELAPISVEGMDSTITETYDLRNNILAAKSNCNIRNGTPHEVTVTVTIEKDVEKEITLLPGNIIPLGAPSAYAFEDVEIKLTVAGPDSVLSGMSEKQVSAVIDLSGLTRGTYELPLNIYLPDKVRIVGEEPVIRVAIS